MRKWLAMIFVFLVSSPALADDKEDASLTTIHNIDMTAADGPSGPNFVLVLFDVKKVKVPGSRAHVIFRQFSKRVRLEFEAAGIPKGKYRIGVAHGCPGSESGWKILNEVTQESTYIANEKSLPQHALRQAPVKGQTVLVGMNVGLFQVKGKKSTLVDCKPIK